MYKWKLNLSSKLYTVIFSTFWEYRGFQNSLYNLLLGISSHLYTVLIPSAVFVKCKRISDHTKGPLHEHVIKLFKASAIANMKPDWLMNGHQKAADLHQILHRSRIALCQLLRVFTHKNWLK